MKGNEKVYMLRHDATGKMYIGRSRDVKKRIRKHLQDLKSGRHRIEDMQQDFYEFGGGYSVTILAEIEGSTKRSVEAETTVRGVGYNYKDPHVTHKKKSTKTKLRELIDTLDEKEVEYVFTLVSKMFG